MEVVVVMNEALQYLEWESKEKQRIKTEDILTYNTSFFMYVCCTR